MSWWGKIVGGAFGFMLGGPLGAVLGAALGHKFDQGLEGLRLEHPGLDPGDPERVQSAFFTATFSVMGAIAKADGRVTRDEISAAEQVMAQMGLNAAQREAAIALFREGKSPDFPLRDVVGQFRRECHRRRNLMRMFIEIQLFAAYADGTLHAAERSLLADICEWLGFSRMEFEELESMARAERHQYEAASAQQGPSLEDAYATLGISPDASDAEVKKAYRRLISRHHPDKLVSKGLPEEMMKMAAQKTHEIRQAYEMIRDARKGR